MKRQLIVAFILGICACMCVAFSTPREVKESKQDTKVFVSKNAEYIETIIEQWSKYGYKVDKLECQSISVSINSHSSGGGYKEPNHRTEKGDIILVMVKYG